MKKTIAAAAAALTVLFAAVSLAAPSAYVSLYDATIAKYGDGLVENLKIRGWHDEYTGNRAHKQFYAPADVDLSDLPPYAPKGQLAGTIRVSGGYLVTGDVGKLWIEGFQKFHPQVKVVTSAGGDLAAGEVDIQTGPRVNDRLLEASRYEGRTGHRLFELDWATGSYNVPGWSPAFAIFVHKDNPIAQMTMQQLDGIFGGARTGGWDGTVWRSAVARGPERNLRTWGQVGLTGAWANKPIHVYGRPLKYNIQLGFERKVFHGGDVWNENTREYSHELNPDGTRYTSAVEMVKDLAKDPYGICFSDVGSTDMKTVKILAIAAAAGQPAYPLSLATLHTRQYPLFIEQWAMVNQEPGKPLAPLVKEFLTYMVSREGQEAIRQDGKWVPIPGSVARAHLQKLETLGAVPRPGEMGLQTSEIAPVFGDGEGPDETGETKPQRAYYSRRFDLGDLPAYKPDVQVGGTIRLPQKGQVFASTVGAAWMSEFKKFQPGVTFEQASGSLTAGKIDAQFGRKWTTYFGGEYMTFQLGHSHSPMELQVATGSYDVAGWSPAITIYVNARNPLARLTVAQLDGIFGGPRRGGWAGTAWRRQVGRGAEKNIRTWGQLGLEGAWANRPIHVYTPPIKYHVMTVFERKVFGGGNMWNDAVREYPLLLQPNDARGNPSAELVKAVAADPYGIAFSGAEYATAGAKAVQLAGTAQDPYVAPSLQSVRDRSYPLALEVYAYLDPVPGKALDPKMREFLRYVLSREGQAAVQRDGKWLPLTAAVIAEQRKKLDTIAEPVNLPSVSNPFGAGNQ